MNGPTAVPGPVRIEVFDLDGPPPDLTPTGRHERAWVVGRRTGVPLALVEIDLTRPAPEVLAELEALRALVGATPTPDLRDAAVLPRISVVVPSVVARLDQLDQCLASLETVRYDDFQILLVDNRREVPTDDPLPALVAGHPHVRVVRAERPGISAARNAGLEAADGEIVVFTDDDVRVDPGWLTAVGRRFVAERTLDAVTGLVLPGELESPAQLYYERYYGGFGGERTFVPLTLSSGHGPVGRARVTARDPDGLAVREFALYGIGAYGAGANMAFRRESLRRRGGFDLTLGTGTPARGGEDLAALVEVLWDGGTLGYEPAAIVYHTHRREMPELEHQMEGNGIGFTALLASLVHRDRAHLVGLGAQLPLAARRLGAQSVERLRGRRSSQAGPQVATAAQFPRSLAVNELRGMVAGPRAYRRSVREGRAWEAGRGTVAAPVPGAVRGGLARLAQDVRFAADHLLLTTVGGSVLLPGTARRLLYVAAGADARSAPGVGFVFGGRPANLTLGPGAYMNQGVYIEAVGPVTIGRDVALGMQAMILTSHHAIDAQGRWSPVATGRPVTIGDRVWIGARAMILPGAVIEPDVVIAAGAVVTGHCRSHGLYAGVPARRIRELGQPPADDEPDPTR